MKDCIGRGKKGEEQEEEEDVEEEQVKTEALQKGLWEKKNQNPLKLQEICLFLTTTKQTNKQNTPQKT